MSYEAEKGVNLNDLEEKWDKNIKYMKMHALLA